MMHPTLTALRAALVTAAAELWEGADVSDMDRNSEYLRGQVELIVQATGSKDGEDPRDDIEGAIRALAYGSSR